MMVVSKYSDSIWKTEEKKFLKIEHKIKIPGKSLIKVDSIKPKKPEDFEKIPDNGGCYWIWTNEPVRHRFHRNNIPTKIRGGEIIYNGIAKDNIRQRVKSHLNADENAKWSGISLDIFKGKLTSHKKKAMASSNRSKVPFLDTEKNNDLPAIREKKALLKLFLSKDEKKFIQNTNLDTYLFRNGINIFDKKHIQYDFKIYFISGLTSLYLEYIEKKWREKHGLPKLCTYSTGR